MREVMRLTKAMAINGTAWRGQVAGKLLDGFGIDDIAIWLDCHRSYVSREVRRLRDAGMLAKWWPGGPE